VKFRIQVVAAILFFGGNLGLAGEKGPLTSQTDFKAMPPEQVLLALKNAEKIEAKIPKNEGRVAQVKVHSFRITPRPANEKSFPYSQFKITRRVPQVPVFGTWVLGWLEVLLRSSFSSNEGLLTFNS
jgi:hypothetical protein